LNVTGSTFIKDFIVKIRVLSSGRFSIKDKRIDMRDIKVLALPANEALAINRPTAAIVARRSI